MDHGIQRKNHLAITVTTKEGGQFLFSPTFSLLGCTRVLLHEREKSEMIKFFVPPSSNKSHNSRIGQPVKSNVCKYTKKL